MQNPDPAAARYFAEYITKAYQALTDEASRQNYEKYGHPDGPQVRRPAWRRCGASPASLPLTPPDQLKRGVPLGKMSACVCRP